MKKSFLTILLLISYLNCFAIAPVVVAGWLGSTVLSTAIKALVEEIVGDMYKTFTEQYANVNQTLIKQQDQIKKLSDLVANLPKNLPEQAISKNELQQLHVYLNDKIATLQKDLLNKTELSNNEQFKVLQQNIANLQQNIVSFKDYTERLKQVEQKVAQLPTQQEIKQLQQVLQQVQQNFGDLKNKEFAALYKVVETLNLSYQELAKKQASQAERESQLFAQLEELRGLYQQLQTQKVQPVVDQRTLPLNFEINYVYRHENAEEFFPLIDKSKLKEGDAFKIIFTPNQQSYVYIFNLDSANKLTKLFPMDNYKGKSVKLFNPVKANQIYYSPMENESFELDNVKGQETLFFMAFQQPDVFLENLPTEMDLSKTSEKKIIKTQQNQQLVQSLFQEKGIRKISGDVQTKTKIIWKERSREHAMIKQKLQMCDGCLNMIKFNHQ